MSRRRIPKILATAAVLLVLASGCNQSNTPQTYQEQDNRLQDNFIQGCTGEGTDTSLASKDTCQCLIEVVMDKVPASDKDKAERTDANGAKHFEGYKGKNFLDLNAQLKTEPDKLPDDLKKAFADTCSSKGYKGEAASGGDTTTTQAGPLVKSTTTTAG